MEKAVRDFDRLLRDTRYNPTKRIAVAGTLSSFFAFFLECSEET